MIRIRPTLYACVALAATLSCFMAQAATPGTPGPQDPPNATPNARTPQTGSTAVTGANGKPFQSSNSAANPGIVNMTPLPTAGTPELDKATTIEVPQGSDTHVMVWFNDRGWVDVVESADARSAAAKALGTDLKQTINTTAPTSSTTNTSSTGSDTDASQSGTAIIPPIDPNLWKSPFLWLGVLFTLGAVGTFMLSGTPIVGFLPMRRASGVLAIVAVCFFCAAAWPTFAKGIIAVGVILAAIAYVFVEVMEKRGRVVGQTFDRTIVGVQKAKAYNSAKLDELEAEIGKMQSITPSIGDAALKLIEDLRTGIADSIMEATAPSDRDIIDARKRALKVGRYNPAGE